MSWRGYLLMAVIFGTLGFLVGPWWGLGSLLIIALVAVIDKSAFG